ncbi:rho GTPase-activating protein 11A-like isoform X2 [Stegodyphus dumicola]|uniref:rho GTPase-activating protein 11A-like isoform X2 n=1 Tax=Stegodyphus dumicola TaxID=202533 RepID=UPI0015A92F44|nr:rho GTPase-activating protein 11A-like isoform X2 [Stegodyphus dumicola]
MIMEGFYKVILRELKILGIEVPKLKKFKATITNREKPAHKNEKKIFGVKLVDQEAVAESEHYLPRFIAFATAYLLKYREREGLLRKTGSIARQKNLRMKLEKGERIDDAEPNDVASLLKQWLRELPEPLIPLYLQELFMRCQRLSPEEKKITAILLSCLLLPPPHLHTFKHLMQFLYDLAASSDRNKMDSHNLARIIAPNVFVTKSENIDKSSNGQVYICTAVIQVLIEHANEIGEVPSSILLHLDLQSDTELDLCDDDSPCKSKKKLLSGPMHEFFHGIRKLVGQGSASAIKKEYADGTDPPSVLRRALSVKGLKNDVACSATNLKSAGKSKKTVPLRQKSIGLLTKRDRNRLKSCKSSFGTASSAYHNSPFVTNNATDVYPTERAMELAEEFKGNQSSLSSHSTIKLVYDDIQKSDSVDKLSKKSILVNDDKILNRKLDERKSSFSKNENIRSTENGIERLQLNLDFGVKTCSKATISGAVFLHVVSETPEESIRNVNNIGFLQDSNEIWSVNQKSHESPKTEKSESDPSDRKNSHKQANSCKKLNLDDYNEVKLNQNQNITLKTDHANFWAESEMSEIVNFSPNTSDMNKFQTTMLSSKQNRNTAQKKSSERRINTEESFLLKNGESFSTTTAIYRTESLRTSNTKFKLNSVHRSLPHRIESNKLSNLVIKKEEVSVTQRHQNGSNRNQLESMKREFSKGKSKVSSSRCKEIVGLTLKHPSKNEIALLDNGITKLEHKNMFIDSRNGSALVGKNICIGHLPPESEFSNFPKCNDGSEGKMVKKVRVMQKPKSRSRNRKNVARVLSDSTKYSKSNKKSHELVRRSSLPNSSCKLDSGEKYFTHWRNNNLNCTELCAVVIPTDNENVRQINFTELQTAFRKTSGLKIQNKNDGNISDSLNLVSAIECLENPSPTSDAAKKRESIAMILKNKSGHVKEKINIYNKLK